MKTFTLFLTLLLACLEVATAQDFKERYFHKWGFAIYTDYVSTPAKKFEADEIDYKGVTTHYTGTQSAWDFATATLFYTARFNISEPSKDKSYSIDIPFSVALGGGKRNFVDVTGVYEPSLETFGRIGIPIYFTVNWGVGSTYACDKDKGYTIGLGIDNLFIGLVPIPSNIVTSRWSTMPSINIGKRYWRKNKCKELNLKLDYLPGAGIPGFAACLSYHRFLNF